jgi:ElaB/YqjD/DUF883 family membrane-anchored ribosome-binding protein
VSTILDEFKIIIGIDGKDAKKGMSEVTNSVKGGMKEIKASVETGLASVSKIFSGFGAAIVGAMSIGSAFGTWKEQSAELGAVSRNLKMSMEDVQGWVGAMGKFGGTSADFESDLRGLNAQLAKMATVGSSRTGKLLESIGIDAGSIGRQRDALDVLEDIAGVIEGMTPDESRGVLQAMGFESSMIMLIQQGREGMKDLIRQKKEDAVYTKEDAEAVKAYNAAMGGLKKNFMGIVSVLFRMVTPALTTITKYISQFVGYIRKHQTAVKAFFVMIAALVTGLLLPAFLNFFRTLLMNPFTWVILGLMALAAVIEDFVGWLDGRNSSLERFWNYLFGDPETAKKNINEIKENIGQLVDRILWFIGYVASGEAWARLKDNANTAYNLIRDRFMILTRNIQQRWDDAIKWITDRWTDAVNFLPNKYEEFSAYIAGKWAELQARWAELTAFLMEQWQSLTDSITAAVEWVQEQVGAAYAYIQQVISQALDWAAQKWESMKARAVAAIEAIKAAISSIGDTIRNAIGGAVDWAVQKLSALKSAVTGGSFSIDVSASDAGGGGGSSYDYSSHSSDTSIGSINNNYYAAPQQSPGDFWGVSARGYNPYQADGGTI